MAERVGYRVVGTIKSVKGICNYGHKVGDQIELDARSVGSICGHFFHGIFPYLVMLQFGGGFPKEWGGPDVMELDCIDVVNTVRIELRRFR